MQMNSPFYGNRGHWGAMPSQQPRHKAPVKVVSIPVHFVRSERSRSESATKIQKVARGFLVRKTMKRIAAIRVEVEQIERTVSAPETAELMRRDDRERLKVGETLMNLLLRLDSVRTLGSEGIRDCRKFVIKKAIALQEMIDHMVEVDPILSPVVQDQDHGQALPKQEEAEAPEDDSADSNSQPTAEDSNSQSIEDFQPIAADSNSLPVEDFQAMPVSDSGSEMVVADSENGVNMEIAVKEDGDGDDGNGGESGREESVGTSLVEEIGDNGLVREEKGEVEREEQEGLVEEDCAGGRRREEGDGNRDLLKRMMEDNERMMGMMAQLFEKNEKQTKLLSSLSHRVELLERAFACEKLRRKKRRKAADAARHKETEPKSCI